MSSAHMRHLSSISVMNLALQDLKATTLCHKDHMKADESLFLNLSQTYSHLSLSERISISCHLMNDLRGLFLCCKRCSRGHNIIEEPSPNCHFSLCGFMCIEKFLQVEITRFLLLPLLIFPTLTILNHLNQMHGESTPLSSRTPRVRQKKSIFSKLHL